MAEKIATRAAYGEALAALANEYPELVVLDADLSGSTMSKTFAVKYPDRFYNIGIAECNMAGIADGLAACVKGKGVSFMENNAGWHGKAPNAEQYEQAKAELSAKIAELEVQ